MLQNTNGNTGTPETETFEQFMASLREIREIQKETAIRMEETDRRMKETDKKISKLGNRFGDLIEHLIVPIAYHGT